MSYTGRASLLRLLGWDVLEETDTSDGQLGKWPQYFSDPCNKYFLRAYCVPGHGLSPGDSVPCWSPLPVELTFQPDDSDLSHLSTSRDICREYQHEVFLGLLLSFIHVE